MSFWNKIRSSFGENVEIDSTVDQQLETSLLELAIVEQQLKKATDEFDEINTELELKVAGCEVLISKGADYASNNKKHLLERIDSITNDYLNEIKPLHDQRGVVIGQLNELIKGGPGSGRHPLGGSFPQKYHDFLHSKDGGKWVEHKEGIRTHSKKMDDHNPKDKKGWSEHHKNHTNSSNNEIKYRKKLYEATGNDTEAQKFEAHVGAELDKKHGGVFQSASEDTAKSKEYHVGYVDRDDNVGYIVVDKAIDKDHALRLARKLKGRGDILDVEDVIEKSHEPMAIELAGKGDVEFQGAMEGHYANVIVRKGDRILFLQRAKNSKMEPGKLCLPGGHIDKGETVKQAAQRELKEEANIECDSFRMIGKIKCADGKWAFYLNAYCDQDPALLDGENSNAMWMNSDEWIEADLFFDLKDHLVSIERLNEAPMISKSQVITQLVVNGLDIESAERVWLLAEEIELTKGHTQERHESESDKEIKKSVSEEEFFEKGLIDLSKLVAKQVTVQGKNGKIYTAIRWVDPDSGKSVAISGSDTHDHEKTDEAGDANKIASIVHDSETSKSQKVRDLIGLGIYQSNILMTLADCAYAQVHTELKKHDIPKQPAVEVSGGTGEDMPDSDGKGIDTSTLTGKKLDAALKEKRKERRSTSGLTYKDFWRSYGKTIEGVIVDGYPKSLIAYGTGGLGKTHDLTVAMEKLEVRVFDPEINPSKEQYDAVVISGGTGIRDMWQIICENRDKLIVFDDCDSMWKGGDDNPAQNILKGMLDTSGDGSVRYGNAGKDPDGNQLPKQIRFTGQVIFISNLKRDAFPQPLIDSRCASIDLTMTKEETLEKLDDIKGFIKLRGKNEVLLDIPTESREAAYQFIYDHQDALDLGQVNGRTFAQVAQIHAVNTRLGGSKKEFEKEAMIRMNLV
jgi:8-oxo-dGTP pyrophosphatase MutT (NUDIX family)